MTDQLDIRPVGYPYIHVSTHAGIFETPVGNLLADEIRVRDDDRGIIEGLHDG